MLTTSLTWKALVLGASGFNQKYVSRWELKSLCWKASISGALCFKRTGFTLRTSFIKASIWGALCQTKKVQCWQHLWHERRWFWGHQVSTKNRFHAENSKVFAERHPFRAHFALKELASHWELERGRTKGRWEYLSTTFCVHSVSIYIELSLPPRCLSISCIHFVSYVDFPYWPLRHFLITFLLLQYPNFPGINNFLHPSCLNI